MDDRIKPGANLQWADLQGADLQGADLQWADLQGADLQGADLQGANLQGADLQGADLQGAKLPPAPMVLLAYWRTLSERLVAQLMLYDAVNADNVKKFTVWAKGGPCPMQVDNYGRAANFTESKEIWLKYCLGKKTAWTARKLADAVLRECCKGWEQKP